MGYYVGCLIEARSNFILVEDNTNYLVFLSSQILINLLCDFILASFKSLHKLLVVDGLRLEETCLYIGRNPRYIKDTEYPIRKLVVEGPIMGFIYISNIFKKFKKRIYVEELNH